MATGTLCRLPVRLARLAWGATGSESTYKIGKPMLIGRAGETRKQSILLCRVSHPKLAVQGSSRTHSVPIVQFPAKFDNVPGGPRGPCLASPLSVYKYIRVLGIENRCGRGPADSSHASSGTGCSPTKATHRHATHVVASECRRVRQGRYQIARGNGSGQVGVYRAAESS